MNYTDKFNFDRSENTSEAHWLEPWVLLGLEVIPWLWLTVFVDDFKNAPLVVSTMFIVFVTKYIKFYLITHVYER